MKQSTKIAIGGIFSAISLIIMMLSYISFFALLTPIIASFIFVILNKELEPKWCVLVYICVSILSFVLVPKEAAMLYIAFFGYYPVLKNIYEKKFSNKIILFVIKFLNFNISTILSFLITAYVFGIPFKESGAVTTIYLTIFFVAMNITFLMYEFFLNELSMLYDKRLKTRLSHMFKR